MNREKLIHILEDLASGKTDVKSTLHCLRNLPFEDIGCARVDQHRALRKGFPEVVFGAGKSTEQILLISERIVAQGGPLLVTRVSQEAGDALTERFPNGCHDRLSRTFHLILAPVENLGRGMILIISAGTSDLPVAQEAALTARLMGNRVEQLVDVGVAGIHRLLQDRKLLDEAEVLVVAAGMEGALPSVVGGLVDRPIIAVPTSVGYGTSFGGLAALLGMLNSCASGVVVVNIDNGFGAGYAASLMNRREHT